MIEMLVLYVLNNREKTIYSVRKEIIELFGHFAKPSLGTIHPALKRLLAKKYVQVTDKVSAGGKKSSYFQITDAGRVYFRDLFFEDITDNPGILITQAHAKFSTLGILSEDDKKLVLANLSKHVDMYVFEIANRLKNEFINFDEYQKKVMEFAILEVNSLKFFAQKLAEAQ